MLQDIYLAMEAQQVIALRLMKFAMGGSAAAQEAQLMVTEKMRATVEALGMVASAMACGTLAGVADAVVRMLYQEVQANRRRLQAC